MPISQITINLYLNAWMVSFVNYNSLSREFWYFFLQLSQISHLLVLMSRTHISLPSSLALHRTLFIILLLINIMCPRSSYPFYTVNYYIKWVTTPWTYSSNDFFWSTWTAWGSVFLRPRNPKPPELSQSYQSCLLMYWVSQNFNLYCICLSMPQF